MHKEPTKNQNNNKYSEDKNIMKENIICKDGFCSIPNQNEISKQNKNDINIFDPIL